MQRKNKPDLSKQLAELDAIIKWFDNPNVDLNEALNKYDQGVALAESIKTSLTEFENKITIISQKFDRQDA